MTEVLEKRSPVNYTRSDRRIRLAVVHAKIVWVGRLSSADRITLLKHLEK